MTSFSTTFPIIENPVSNGGQLITSTSPGVNWSGLGLGNSGTLPVAPIDVVGPGMAESVDYANPNYGDALAVATGSWAPNQTASVIVGSLVAQPGGFPEFEIHLRTDPATGAGYEISWSYNQNYILVATWNAHGGFTNLLFDQGAQYAVHPGDTLTASIQGNVITLYDNGIKEAQVTDNTFSSGNPGFGFDAGSSGTAEYGISSFSASDSGTSPPHNVAPTTIQNDYLAITRTTLALDQATTISNAIGAGTQTETQYVSGLLSQVANTTIPAVAVEASMYGAVGSSTEITLLTNQFLPGQVAFAMQHGLNPQIVATEALGLVFAFGNETGNTTFANNFGPSNPAMPNSTPGDAAFAAAAATSIFGSASTTNLLNVIDGFVTNWKAFYISVGVLPGIPNPTAALIDLAARGAAWGDLVGVALSGNIGPLDAQVTNFLEDAAQGIAQYGVSIVGQAAHHQFA